MKLLDPTIYVLHKIGEDWAKSSFVFDGLVDRRRIKREIIRAFKRGGETVSPQYIDACINASMNTATVGIKVDSRPVDISEAENAQTLEVQ